MKIKHSSKKRPPNIDGLSKDVDIANSFATKNETLYNSVPSYDFDDIFKRVERGINGEEFSVHKINVFDVVKAVNKTKSGKSDGDIGFNSNHVKLAPRDMIVQLS